MLPRSQAADAFQRRTRSDPKSKVRMGIRVQVSVAPALEPKTNFKNIPGSNQGSPVSLAILTPKPKTEDRTKAHGKGFSQDLNQGLNIPTLSPKPSILLISGFRV